MTLRPLISLTLALILALSSQSMAVARGASAGTGQMVICSGVGVTVIYVDSEGQPTAAPHICPDATLLVGADVPDVGPVGTPLDSRPVLWQAYAQSQIHRIAVTRTQARAPPLA